MSTNIIYVFEELKKNKNIGNKIKLIEDKQTLKIEFHEFLIVAVYNEVREYTIDIGETHWHLDTDDEVIKNLTEIANGDIIFIKNTGLFAHDIKIMTRDKMETMFRKWSFGRKNQRIYTGNMIFKREKELWFEWELIPTNPLVESPTYLIPRNELTSTVNYEFQKGKYKNYKSRFANSLYLYEDELEEMLPFSLFIENFDMCGITYLDEQKGKKLVRKLQEFAKHLATDKSIIEILKQMEVYTGNESWRIEDNLNALNKDKLKNTTEALAYWIEQTLQTYDTISIIGI